MKKNISFKLDKTKLTISNGDNIICDNQEISGRKVFEVDTDLNTTITLTPNVFCDFSSIPELQFMWQYTTTIFHRELFTKAGNSYTLTTDFKFEFEINENLVITSSLSYATAKYALLQLDLKDCECNIQAGNILPAETTFIISCSENNEFQIIPSITYGGNVERRKGEMITKYLEKIDDTSYSITLNTATEWLYVINAESVKKSAINDKYGLITAYKLTKDDLRIISTKRYVKPEYEPVIIDNTIVLYNVNYEYIDTAKYIVALHRVNIKIPVADIQRVKFGPYDMELDCGIVENDTIMLDFGSIEIQGIYNNAIDFDNTEINIYLPYIGIISLNTADCMNKTLSLKYQINLLNGDSLALIYANDSLILSHSCNIAVKIPYRMSDNEEINTQLDTNNSYLNNEAPFVITRTNIATNTEILPYHDTNFYAVLGDLSGYTEATEISFNVINDFITQPEIEEIKSLIAKGIII